MTTKMTTRQPYTASAPTSPVTPLRRHHQPSVNHSFAAFPSAAPSTPYTPSNLSFASTAPPMTPVDKSVLQDINVSLLDASAQHQKGISETAEEWPTKGDGNSVSAAKSEENQYAADDEGSDLHSSGPSPVPQACAQSPTIRRRSRTHTQSASLQLIPDADLPTRSAAVLNTPPPRMPLSRDLQLKGSATEPSHFNRRRSPFSQDSSELYDIDEDAYISFPHSTSFASPGQTSLSLHDPFADPFPVRHDLSLRGSTPEHDGEFPIFSLPLSQSSPPRNTAPNNVARVGQPLLAPPIMTCSVCARTAPRSLAILSPCKHPLCSACLTSALNIVGEKDMACAVCGSSVDDFKLTSTEAFGGGDGPKTIKIFDSLGNVAPHPASVENVVLRIDNVPWDVTPPMLAAWLPQPLAGAHVLLDPKGKTRSHAYIELANPEDARAALRQAQNSVLGKGRRARGVTVTRTAMRELRSALFPNWDGRHGRVMTKEEHDSIRHLIRSPDAHFLKVPELPYHLLVSILQKYPKDSVVGGDGDALFDLASTAVEHLVARVRTRQTDITLLEQLLMAGMSCYAFTPHQQAQLSQVKNACFPQAQEERNASVLPVRHNYAQEQLPPVTHYPQHAPPVHYIHEHRHGFVPEMSQNMYVPQEQKRTAMGQYMQPAPGHLHRQYPHEGAGAQREVLQQVPINRQQPNNVTFGRQPPLSHMHQPQQYVAKTMPTYAQTAQQNVHSHTNPYMDHHPVPLHARPLTQMTGQADLASLAREFGVQAEVIEALAQRLSTIH